MLNGSSFKVVLLILVRWLVLEVWLQMVSCYFWISCYCLLREQDLPKKSRKLPSDLLKRKACLSWITTLHLAPKALLHLFPSCEEKLEQFMMSHFVWSKFDLIWLWFYDILLIISYGLLIPASQRFSSCCPNHHKSSESKICGSSYVHAAHSLRRGTRRWSRSS